MEHSPSRQTHSNHSYTGPSSQTPSNMAMLAAPPAPHAGFQGFQRDYMWDHYRSPTYSSQPSQGPSPGSVSLPPIRHQFPELLSQEAPPYPQSSNTSPNSGSRGRLTSPAYVHSPLLSKRRRDSFDDDQERERARQVPRLYRSPQEHIMHQPASPLTHAQPPAEAWGPPVRSTPYPPGSSRVPAPVEVPEMVEPRPSVPTLPPTMGVERNAASAPTPPTRDHRADAYQDARPATATATALQVPQVADHTPRYVAAPPPPGPPSQASYEFSYRQPSQLTAPTPPRRSTYERTPFTTAGYTRGYGDYSRYADLGHLGMGGDSKQRKRRGNLPKETTDKLRSWFMAHLSHPYPTEDEKQELMRQTGLQMNQISNWFINARRRQLPTMISNARVESDAISNRAGDNHMLPSTERADMRSRRDGLALSDGEGGAYDEEMESLKRHRAPVMDRGSV